MSNDSREFEAHAKPEEQLSEQEVEKRSAWVEAALNDVLNERRHQEEIAALKSSHSAEREALVRKCAEIANKLIRKPDGSLYCEGVNDGANRIARDILALLSDSAQGGEGERG